MAWIFFLLSLLYHCSGVRPQQITQPASQSASLGQTVRLPCSKSSADWESYFFWYRQKPGQGPHYVNCNGCSAGRGEGIPDRFTVSASGDVGYLTITNVQAEDEANYYCGEWERTGGWKYIFGGGTHLTVLGQDPSSPKLSVYPPSPEEIKTKDKATLVCLVNDFYPGIIQVDWTADGTKITQGVETAKPTKHGDKYISSSYLTLSTTDWKQHNAYTCRVTHEGKSVEESISPSTCP